jgi:hypothetical protein
MVVNRLQDGLVNSRIASRPSRLNCQNIFSNGNIYFFFSNSDRDFYSENKKKITLTFEPNDDYQAGNFSVI